MKNLYFLIVSVIMIMTSCEPPIVTKFGCTDKRIKNIETGGKYYRLIYDSDGRLVEKKLGLNTIENNEFSFGTATFKNGTITSVITTDDTIIPDGELAISSIITGENIGGGSTLPVNAIYTYNAAGNLQMLVVKQGTLTITSNYTWQTGNLTKIITTRSVGSPATKTTVFTYFNDVANSTSNDFQGIKIFGKQSYNAPKTMTVSASGMATVITNYNYRINECGCITNATVQAGTTTSNIEYTYEKLPE
jgi:hypothetical protein